MGQVMSQEIRTSGMDWEPLQTVDPSAEPRQINSFRQTLLVDYTNRRIRLTFDATRTYPTTAPVKFVEVIDGDTGVLEGSKERLHPSRLATRLRDYNRLPIRLLFTARGATDLIRAEDRTVEGSIVHVLKYTDGGAPVELHLDAESKLPVRVIYMEDDPVYGDTPNELSYLEWKDYDGVRLPEKQVTRLNNKKIREENLQTLTNNPPLESSAFAIPDETRAQPENGERIVSQWVLRRVVMGVGYQDFGREQKVELAEVAPGVYHVRGGSHHSMVVEMKDHLVVVEAPLFDERSVAVIRALEEKFPGKPIKTLVITHFHFDHIGGVRAYTAKGAHLVAHTSILPFIGEMTKGPHTLRPDSLAKVFSKPSVLYTRTQGVRDVTKLSDGERTIELHAIPNDHAAGMLIAYLPKEKVVFVSDLYSPPDARAESQRHLRTRTREGVLRCSGEGEATGGDDCRRPRRGWFVPGPGKSGSLVLRTRVLQDEKARSHTVRCVDQPAMVEGVSLLCLHKRTTQHRRSVPDERLGMIGIFSEYFLRGIQHTFERVRVAVHRGKQVVAHLIGVQASLGKQCCSRENHQQESKWFHGFTSAANLSKVEIAVSWSPTKWEDFPMNRRIGARPAVSHFPRDAGGSSKNSRGIELERLIPPALRPTKAVIESNQETFQCVYSSASRTP